MCTYLHYIYIYIYIYSPNGCYMYTKYIYKKARVWFFHIHICILAWTLIQTVGYKPLAWLNLWAQGAYEQPAGSTSYARVYYLCDTSNQHALYIYYIIIYTYIYVYKHYNMVYDRCIYYLFKIVIPRMTLYCYNAYVHRVVYIHHLRQCNVIPKDRCTLYVAYSGLLSN